MIPLIEQLFEKCIPKLQNCYEFCMNIQFPFGNVPNKDGDFDKVTFQSPLKRSLYDSELQVITKILLLDLHMGRITSYSTLKMTAVIITAARLAFGIKAQYGKIRPKARMTKTPVQRHPMGVLTPIIVLFY